MNKTIVAFFLLLCVGSVSALPTSYVEPELLIDGSISVNNIATFGVVGNYWLGGGPASGGAFASNDLYIFSGNTTINTVDHGSGIFSNGWVDNGVLAVFGSYYYGSVLYVNQLYYYNVNSPVSPILINSTSVTCGGGSPDFCLFGEAYFVGNDAYVNAGAGIYGYKTSLSGNAIIKTNFNTIISDLVRVTDTAEYNGEQIFIGSNYVGSKRYAFNENYDVIANLTEVDSVSHEKWYWINNNFAVERTGYIVSLAGLTTWDTLSSRCGNGSFTVVEAYAMDYILGVDASDSKFKICDASNLVNITLTDTGVNALGTSGTQIADGVINVDNALWLLTPPSLPSVSNEPPLYQVKFLGTDPAVNNFLFRVEMQDVEGGSAYYAQLVNKAGLYYNATTVTRSINFNQPSDLSYVSNQYCQIFNLAASSPGNLYGADGFLLLNETSCLYPTTIAFQPVVTSEVDGNISLSSNIRFSETPKSGSYSIYSSSNVYIGQLLFDLGSFTANITLPNGTIVAQNVTFNSGWFTIVATINPSTSIVNWKVYNNIGVNIVNVNVPIATSFLDIGKVVIDSYLSQGITSVDDVTVSATVSTSYPTYVFFGILPPAVSGVYGWQQSKVPINNQSYGLYETYLWGTDQEHGLSYYVDPDFEEFTFNAQTPKLTDAEVQAILNDLNTGGAGSFGTGVVEGDIATDWLPQIYSSIGIKTQASRFLFGLALLVIITLMASTAGSVGIIIIDTVAAVIFAFPQIGLFPSWFLIVYVIIAAAVGANALRKTGGG